MDSAVHIAQICYNQHGIMESTSTAVLYFRDT